MAIPSESNVENRSERGKTKGSTDAKYQGHVVKEGGVKEARIKK
jgi:hypothetical protein